MLRQPYITKYICKPSQTSFLETQTSCISYLTKIRVLDVLLIDGYLAITKI